MQAVQGALDTYKHFMKLYKELHYYEQTKKQESDWSGECGADRYR